MSGQNWYPHYARDFLKGIQGIGPDVIGTYIVVLDLIYSQGGPVKNDARFISGIMGCSSRLAASLIQKLIDAGKLTLEDGLLANPKAAEVLENAAKRTRNLSEAGAKGGRNRAEKEAEARKNSGLGQAGLNHITGQDNISKNDDDVMRGREALPALPGDLDSAVPADTRDCVNLANECARIAGVRFIDPGHIATGVGLVRDWIASGADAELIRTEVQGGVVACTDPRGVSSLKFFDSRIRTAVAKRKALENGTPASTRNKPVDEVAARALARMAARRAARPEGDMGLLGGSE